MNMPKFVNNDLEINTLWPRRKRSKMSRMVSMMSLSVLSIVLELRLLLKRRLRQ